MFEVRDLHVRRGDKTIIDGCSFAVHSSGVLVILGANGVGKTTLLNTMIGVLKPSRGHMEIGGKIGFVPQLFEVAFSYSVMDIALMGRVRHIGLFGSPGTRDFARSGKPRFQRIERRTASNGDDRAGAVIRMRYSHS